MLTQFGRQIGFAIVEQRSDVILQSAFAAALVIEEERLAVAQHDVARLEIAVEKIVVAGGKQKPGQAPEILLEGLFIERHAGKAEEIILEIVEVPGDGLAIEARTRVTDFVVQIAGGLD